MAGDLQSHGRHGVGGALWIRLALCIRKANPPCWANGRQACSTWCVLVWGSWLRTHSYARTNYPALDMFCRGRAAHYGGQLQRWTKRNHWLAPAGMTGMTLPPATAGMTLPPQPRV